MTQGAWFVSRKNLVGRPRCTPQPVFSFQKEDLCSYSRSRSLVRPTQTDAHDGRTPSPTLGLR